MGNVCSPRLGGKDFEIPDLRAKNRYGTTEQIYDDSLVRTVFPISHEENKNSRVLEQIQQSKDHLFEDSNFRMASNKSLRLSILFNFETNRTRIFSKKEETDITNFIQLNIEFSYLTSVFYLLCNRKAKGDLLPKMIENQQTNMYGCYSAHIWCNGEHHNVIVDDRMPTHSDNFLYLRVVKGIELWPLILEKAWVKMIGSYESALGLSPEESFEELTGAPAYTYTMRANNRETIKSIMSNAKQNGYWVALIARNGLKDIQNRQVFMLESFDYTRYTIISPYVSYQFERHNQSRRGEVIVEQEDIFTHFEHVVVGFYKDGYVPHTIPVTTSSRQQVLFELKVNREEEVSIRFNQLYHGYFKPEDRPNYQYSPILIELYELNETDGNRRCVLRDYCQGCSRSLIGHRSSQCSRNVMERLSGKYLIKLEVDWLYDGALNTGNLVVYGSEDNIELRRMENSQKVLLEEVYPDIFKHNPGINDIILHQHNLEVHTYDKEKTTLIQFHNITADTHHFQADFAKSKNIILRGRQISGQYAYIRLQPDEKTIVEVLPKDLTKHIEIENFEIHKIPIKE